MSDSAILHMLGDQVFVLAMMLHSAFDNGGVEWDASLDKPLGDHPATSILELEGGHKYRVTVEPIR